MKAFPMKIKTKRKKMLCGGLTNNNCYFLISIISNPSTLSGVSFVIIDDNDSSETYDSSFFRLNTLEIDN